MELFEAEFQASISNEIIAFKWGFSDEEKDFDKGNISLLINVKNGEMEKKIKLTMEVVELQDFGNDELYRNRFIRKMIPQFHKKLKEE